MGWTTQPLLGPPATQMDQRRVDYLRLLRQAPPITEISYLDPEGREQLRVSRLAMDVAGGGTSFSREPKFLEPKAGRIFHGPVYFRKESEPYMTIALGGGLRAGVTVAEVNLKFIWDVVSQIKIGKAGHAYVVDSRGQLIAHPDISLVLQKTDLSALPQVQQARAASAAVADAETVTTAHDRERRPVLAAFATIAPLGWSVFVEQPLGEAFAPLYASAIRTAVLLLLGVALAVVASLFLARRMVTPIQALQAGAARIGAGELGHRIEIRTGDELEALAAQFNSTTAQLQESYATLERKVEERTRELSESLEQQTATSEVLRIISSSPTDIQPVMEAVAAKAARLSEADDALIGQAEGDSIRWLAAYGTPLPTAGQPISRSLPTGRAILDRQTTQVEDVSGLTVEFPSVARAYRDFGVRSILATPLLREDKAVGVLLVRRRRVQAFSDKQIALLKTFADQAVIAIENVRLFTELQERTRDLARSVDELKALGEVGRAVSSTLDLETVLATIVSRANQLSGTDAGAIFEYDEATELFHLRATQNLPDDVVEALRATPLRTGEGAVGRLATTREPIQIPDVTVEGAYRSRVREALLRTGYRALLAVPMLREDHIIGGLGVERAAPGAGGVTGRGPPHAGAGPCA